MVEIEEQFVSFDVAKLLKVKGFAKDSYTARFKDRPTVARYWVKNDEFSGSDEDGWPVKHHCKEGNLITKGDELWYSKYCTENSICAPTQERVGQWLRKDHSIFITVFPECLNNYSIIKYWFRVEKFEDGKFWTEYQSEVRMLSYEDAYEEAIRYCLKNLV